MFTLVEYMIIWCKIHVIINPFLWCKNVKLWKYTNYSFFYNIHYRKDILGNSEQIERKLREIFLKSDGEGKREMERVRERERERVIIDYWEQQYP